MGTFKPLVFGTNGGIGPESQLFLKWLANKLSRKTGESWRWLYIHNDMV